MDNPETRAILGTPHRTETNKTKQKQKHSKLKRWAIRTTPNNRGVREGWAVPDSYKTTTVLFFVKSAKIPVGDVRKEIYLKVKRSNAIREMNISFRNGQPIRDKTLLNKWLLH